MEASIAFYEALGLHMLFGGPGARLTSFACGTGFVNLIPAPGAEAIRWWGRVILHVDDVDAVYERALGAGLSPESPPRDAEWGERYFHITDPDGHELSIARPL
jgi:catechol 2,3-dioxygenase-like lactoylglutathione lyase family enzyme